MKYTIKIGVTLLMLLLSTTMFAQEVKVSGTVFDETSQPMIGVTVSIKGTTRGTSTDAKGSFALNAKKGETVLFSFIGYDVIEKEVGTNAMTALSLQMKPQAEKIEEVLVTVGYGQMAKKDLSGAVSTVSTTELEKSVSGNFANALTGRMAGVQATSSEGAPGAGVDITIRGGNSLTGSNAPLWVIDGFPVDDPNTFSFDAKDIEQMQVLKDASATAIYGARGANGVIIIETKKGKSGEKLNIEYSGAFSSSNIPRERKIDVMNGMEYLRYAEQVNPEQFRDYYLVKERFDADGKELKYINARPDQRLTIEDYANMPNLMFDYQDEAFNPAFTQSHRLGLSGGTDQTQYNISMSAFDQDGTLMGTGLDRYNVRASLTQKLSKKLSFTGMVNYNKTNRHGLQSSEGNRNSVIRDILQYKPVNPYKYGDLGADGVPVDVDTDTNNITFNPIRNIKNAYREVTVDQLTLNASLSYQLAKGLKLMGRGGYTYYNSMNDQFNNANSRYGHPVLSATDGINAVKEHQQTNSWFNEYTLTYAKKWDKHRFDVMGGYTMQGYDRKNMRNKWIQFPSDVAGMNDLSLGKPLPAVNSQDAWFMMSFLARTNYVYDDKYIFTASMRADGSSKFLGKNKFGYFPSAAAAWRVSQEKWMHDVYWLSNLKLRASWGMTGNNNIPSGSAYGSYYNGIFTGYPFDSQLTVGLLPERINNDKLKWETTTQTNIGLDLGLWGERVSLTVDWYDKVTRDLLLNADLPTSSGYTKAQKNIGSVGNRGWEFSINTTNIRTRDFTWTSAFNISLNKSRVISLDSGQDYMLRNPNWYHKFAQSQYIAQVGRPVSMFYGYKFDGVYQNDDFYFVDNKYVPREGLPTKVGSVDVRPGSPKYRDIDGNGVIDANDMTVIGNPNPAHFGGLTNNFQYKNFDLSVFLTWSYGNQILNANDAYFSTSETWKNNGLSKLTNAWTPSNPSNSVSSPNIVSDFLVSSRSVEDGSYLRISNVSLGYNLNAGKVRFLNKLGLSKIRLYASVDNLFVFTKYSGYDPEVNTSSLALERGLDYSSYPRSRTYTFGIDLKF